MYLSILVVPTIIIIVGCLLLKCPPQKINIFVGYRTKKSMKKKKVWDYSNTLCAKLFIKFGIGMFIGCFIIYILNYFNILNLFEEILVILVFIEIAFLFLIMLIIENRLKKL